MNYLAGTDGDHPEALQKFCHEMGVKEFTPQARISEGSAVTSPGASARIEARLLPGSGRPRACVIARDEGDANAGIDFGRAEESGE